MERRKPLTAVSLNAVVILIALVSMIPFVVLLQVTLSTPQQMAEHSVFHAPNFASGNLSLAWQKSQLGLSMLNSTAITITSLIITIFASSSASYCFARSSSKITNTIFNVFVFSMAIPGIVSTVPLYLLMRSMRLINNLWGMTLLCSTSSIPFACFLYTSFIRATPKDIEEAAIIDGCSKFTAFWRVVFPILKPITATVLLLNAVFFWNEYGRAVFFLQKKEVYTVPLSIATFANKYSTNWTLMAAGTVIAMIPVVVVFLVFQKQYIKGLASGAVKG